MQEHRAAPPSSEDGAGMVVVLGARLGGRGGAHARASVVVGVGGGDGWEEEVHA
jgi:hypothetical protein